MFNFTQETKAYKLNYRIKLNYTTLEVTLLKPKSDNLIDKAFNKELQLEIIYTEMIGWRLSTLAPDTSGELDVLGHDGHALGVNGAEVSVLKETNEVGLGGLLEGGDSGALEAEVSLEVLRNLTNQALERELPDQKLCALLVLPNLAESHRPRPESVRLLHAAGGRSRLSSGLRRQLLARSLSACGLASGLLRTGH